MKCYFVLNIWHLLVFQVSPGMAAVGGHPPFGSLCSPGLDQRHRTTMYISAEI